MSAIDWLRDEIHHFDVAHQARVIAIAERALAEGVEAGAKAALNAAKVGSWPAPTAPAAPEQPDEAPVSLEVGQVMPQLPPTLDALPKDEDPPSVAPLMGPSDDEEPKP